MVRNDLGTHAHETKFWYVSEVRFKISDKRSVTFWELPVQGISSGGQKGLEIPSVILW